MTKKAARTCGLREAVNLKLPAELQALRSLRHFVSAGLIGRSVGGTLVRADEIVGQKIGFDFFAADVGQDRPIDLNAWAEHLAALFDHFLTLRRVINDIAIFEGQIIFAHNGADTLAPAAGRFQVSNDLWF